VNTRNYFTHYTSSLKSKAFNDDVLQWINDKLRALLIIVLLKEIGLVESLIRGTICNNKELAYGLSEGGIRSVCDH
jgi:ApeA N-terminal domain 1